MNNESIDHYIAFVHVSRKLVLAAGKGAVKLIEHALRIFWSNW